ncbi:MAG TPA: transcriptional regulator NrdR [bacterium]|nr:transcriptional regulator NrdR [bacterium]HPO07055.1 transcriptional regulator NrdR [bacterium]HQO33587.1 transcriptional regulator NrdR [bacterium]HQP99069.1 transcriptional regulator NrdR [bacterium]
MKCPYCGSNDDQVVDSRNMNEGEIIRRRRKCLSCQKRFTTYERIEEIRLMVIKRDERRELYSRDKIIKGIRIACQKRPISEQQIEELALTVERTLFRLNEREVPTSVIGEEVMRLLHELDQVAYVRFASVYRQFKDINQFLHELRHMMEPVDSERK